MSLFTPKPPPESPEAQRPAPLPPRKGGTVPNALAFLLSAVLSPYLVILFGTVGIVYARSDPQKFWLHLAISLFFSIALPTLYVLYGIKKGFISDVHVMEREQRNGPFAVAIGGSFLAGLILFLIGAAPSVWGLSVILVVNGLLIWLITLKTKISVHVSVLSATALGTTILHPEVPPLAFAWMVPALIWARWYRRRHTIWQGLGGAALSGLVTTLIIVLIGLGERVIQLLQRLAQLFQIAF